MGIFGAPQMRQRVSGGYGIGAEEPGPKVPYGLLANPAYWTPGIGDGQPGAMSAPSPADGQRGPVSLMPLDMPLQKPVLPENRPRPEFVPMTPLPGVKPKQPAFFGEGGTGRNIIGAIADAMLQMNGARPIFAPAMERKQQMAYQQRQQQAEWNRQDAQRQQDHQWAVEDRDWKAKQPRYFASGRDQVEYDPATDVARVIYDGPADFEEYAATLGLEPGTDEYNEAVQDYQLRGNGPTALAGRREMENLRQGNRVSMEGIRQTNRAALRGMPTYSNLHPRPAGGSGGGNRGGPPRSTGQVYAPIFAKVARGEPLTAGEQQIFNLYGRGGRGTGGKSAGSSSGGGNPVATDAKGNKVQWDGKAWRPVG
ncbi:hypothetical protein [Sphingobium fuliginis]|nr:hypothetical protein [Sphingobium fuliginis]RYL98681.1 hypothetical protein EWH10_09220 [Sphingobium fuliginis]